MEHSRQGGAKESGYFFEPLDYRAHVVCERNEGRNNWLVGKGLTVFEKYLKGGVNLLAVFRDPLRPSLFPVCELRYWPSDDWSSDPCHIGKRGIRGGGINLPEVQPIDRERGNDGSHCTMFVGNIEIMRTVLVDY
jgi:hypothetical protein